MDDNFIYDEVLNKINAMHNILIDIKDGTDDIEEVNELFRAIHTIKGAAELLFMDNVVKIVHKSEDILQEVRDGKISLDKNLVHFFVEIKDYIKLIVTDTYEGFADDETLVELKHYFDKKFEAFKSKIVLIISDDTNVDSIKEDDLFGYTILKSKNILEANKVLHNCQVNMLFLDLSSNDEKLLVKFVDTLKNIPH